MSSKPLPIQNPVQPIIHELQKCLRANCKATIEGDPQGYFAYHGAQNHLQYSLRMLKNLNSKGLATSAGASQKEIDLLIKQLGILDRNEWILD
ncbi:hypothetical protein [Vibrio crassostreae]|uniref:hypothetical protein n=1 Tax=Vibrio crassostreae TaxID=246167 RepID=UPI001B31696A|nr:hypothetical protein [Vibrio crassostreae]